VNLSAGSETWIRELTGENFLAVYDVILDIRSALQFDTNVSIPVVPQVVKFAQLMPADSIGLRDRYGELRWRAAELLKSKGVIRTLEVLKGSHRWFSDIGLTVDAERFNRIAKDFDDEHGRRRARAPGGAPAPSKPSTATQPSPPTVLPDRVTLHWLVGHVPISAWIWLLGIVIAAAVVGAKAGQTSLVRDLLGEQAAPRMSSDELKIRVDKLVEGHNATITQITARIVEEEGKAAATINRHEQDPHVQAAERLRKMLDDEQQRFQKALVELKAMGTPRK